MQVINSAVRDRGSYSRSVNLLNQICVNVWQYTELVSGTHITLYGHRLRSSKNLYSIRMVDVSAMPKPSVLLLSEIICALLCSSTHARTLAQVSGAVALLLNAIFTSAFPLKLCTCRPVNPCAPLCHMCSIASVLRRHLSLIHLFVLCRV